jgi:asparagine synthase (glutamine-hydrolysing)
MGMANSLEIRFPFLDYKLVEYVLSLTDELKHSTYYKKVLVDLTREWIPSAIIERDKIDFVLPLEKWMKNELNSFCIDSISNLKFYPQLNMRKINLLWKDFLKGNTNISWLQMWTLVVLGKWTADNISINKS